VPPSAEKHYFGTRSLVAEIAAGLHSEDPGTAHMVPHQEAALGEFVAEHAPQLEQLGVPRLLWAALAVKLGVLPAVDGAAGAGQEEEQQQQQQQGKEHVLECFDAGDAFRLEEVSDDDDDDDHDHDHDEEDGDQPGSSGGSVAAAYRVTAARDVRYVLIVLYIGASMSS
jgi:hypothetical protein